MKKENNKRKGCKDVFNSFLVNEATYAGVFEIPVINGITDTNAIPNKVTVFSKANSVKEPKGWVHFYEDDVNFERIWNNPQRYLDILKRFEGVILPDFSLYRDMPLAMQIWNIYRSRAIGTYLEKNNILVIPNLRFGDERTFEICCQGLKKGSVYALGSHGTLKNTEDRAYFCAGLEFIVDYLVPKTLIIYGKTPPKIFRQYKERGIRIVQFESDYFTSRKKVE